MKKRLLSLLVIAALCLGLAACGGTKPAERETLPVTSKLTATVLSVGKADAIVITTDLATMVIDTGEIDDGGKILNHLQDLGISAIDYLIITHYDRDHVGGAERLLQNMEVRQVIRPAYTGVREEYTAFTNALHITQTPDNAMAAGADLVFMMEDVRVTICAPTNTTYTNELGQPADNELSLVVKLHHGRNVLLFTGDAEIMRLAELIVSDMDLSADFLKVPHHGNYNDLTAAFFKKVSPSWAVICDSEKNPADEDTLFALRSSGSNPSVLQTKDGSVTCQSDGVSLSVEQQMES